MKFLKGGKWLSVILSSIMKIGPIPGQTIFVLRSLFKELEKLR